jgi:hypothetical protein
MADDLSINQILRLRGNVVSMQRATERCRHALPEQDATAQDAPLPDSELAAEEELIAEVMRARQRAAEYNATLTQAQLAAGLIGAAARTQAHPDPDFPPRFPDSFDTMKAAMAQIVADSDRRLREAAPQVVDDRASPSPAEIRAAALGTNLISATARPRR